MVDAAILDAAAARSFAAAACFRESAPYRALSRLFSDRPAEVAAAQLLADRDWVGELLAPLIANLGADPWFEPPFRVARDPLRIGAILFESPTVSIAATILSADALAVLPAPRTVVMAGRLTLTRYVRAGGAHLRLWDVAPAGPDFRTANAPRCTPARDLTLTDGQIVRLDGRTCGHILVDATCDVVTLSATIRAETAPLAREYAIADGALLKVATNDDRAARTQMLLSYLRLAGRTDPACYEATTHDPAFFLRWAAMREWLAVSAATAVPRLHAMAADDPNAEIRAAATATLAQLQLRRAA